MPSLLPETVREAARRFGDTPLMVDPDGTVLTYRALDERSDAVARGLREAGVGEGDVVAVALPSSGAYAVTYTAAAKVGAVTAGVNVVLSDEEQARLVELVQPAVTVRAPVEVAALERPGPAVDPLPDDPDRPVAVVFTSGTTGTPKGAVFGERQLRALAAAEVGDTWGGGGASYNSTPFPHVGFMGRFPWQLRLGGTVHLMARFRAEEALRLVEELRLRSIGGIGAQVALMMRHADFERRDVSSVETVVLGGGPVDPALRREIRERFDAKLSIRFSCTESGGIGCGTALDAPDEEALETVGRPRGPVRLSIRDEGGTEVPPGEVGEVCFLTPTAMTGYWQDPEATAAAFWPDGALRTGDLGWVDPEGCLRLAGRSKEMYVRGGYNVYPAEVEAVLRSHPAVEDVAVVGRTDPVMGEAGVAFVVAAPGAAAPSLEELRAFGAERLAPYKLPEDLRVVDALPLTALDKVDRRALEAMVEAR